MQNTISVCRSRTHTRTNTQRLLISFDIKSEKGKERESKRYKFENEIRQQMNAYMYVLCTYILCVCVYL